MTNSPTTTSSERSLSRAWRNFLIVALVLGAIFRLIWVEDMEYKTDEAYIFRSLMNDSWSWVGMESGVKVRNPGMSIWVFMALGKLFGASDPTSLCRIVMIVNTLALFWLAWIAVRRPWGKDREFWLWGTVLAAVNPLCIWIQRKIWQQSILPIFSLAFFVAWWNRGKNAGAFFWGLVGAILGQIHMSGFFFALAFVLWALAFDRKRVRWLAWFAGSVLGALPLIPWALEVMAHPETNSAMGTGFSEILKARFLTYWFTNPVGLQLGNTLGAHWGKGVLAHLSDFIRYPIVGGRPTYLVAGAHLALLFAAGAIYVGAARRAWRERKNWKDLAVGRGSETAFSISAAFWPYWALLTASTVMVRRYYFVILGPLDSVWIARMAFASRRGRAYLALLFAAFTLVSAAFLGYVHVNGGSPKGDYADSYRVKKEKGELP